MARFDLESIVKRAVEKALNKKVCGGKTITEWAAIGMATSWISVKDKLPENDGVYLAFYDGESVSSVWYERGRAHSEWTDDYEGYLDLDVTHWMPLPEPPEGVSGDA